MKRNSYVKDLQYILSEVEDYASVLAKRWGVSRYEVLPREFSFEQSRLEFDIKLCDWIDDVLFKEIAIKGTAWNYGEIKIDVRSFDVAKKAVDENGFVTKFYF